MGLAILIIEDETTLARNLAEARRVVDLAGILVQRPSVVLLDEPSSGIAQKETEALAPLLVRLASYLGATSHSLCP